MNKMKLKKIIISCNPDDACVAAEVEVIRKYKNYASISSINLNQLYSSR
jgi:hypothetical protein